MKKIFFIFTITLSFLFASNYNNIDANKAFEMQKNGAILIDVRTKMEYNYAHAKGAILIPIFYAKFNQRVENREFINQVTQLVKGNLNKKILLICRSGSRTKYASKLLANNGFTQINNILYGFATKGGWLDSNLPIER